MNKYCSYCIASILIHNCQYTLLYGVNKNLLCLILMMANKHFVDKMTLHLLKQFTVNAIKNLLHIYNFIYIYKSIKDNPCDQAKVKYCSITTVVQMNCYLISY